MQAWARLTARMLVIKERFALDPITDPPLDDFLCVDSAQIVQSPRLHITSLRDNPYTDLHFRQDAKWHGSRRHGPGTMR